MTDTIQPPTVARRDFLSDTDVESRADGQWATPAPHWQMWGPYGGYLAALCLRSIPASGRLIGHPASASFQFLASGKASPVQIQVESLREGRQSACVETRLRQDGRELMRGQVWCAQSSDGPRALGQMTPDVPPPAPLTAEEDRPGPASDLWSNLVGRPGRSTPRASLEPQSDLWLRLRSFDETTTDPFLQAARILTLVDLMPWNAFLRGQAGSPAFVAPTLDLSVWFHKVPVNSHWLLVRGDSTISADGLIYGSVKVYDEDGELTATAGSHLRVTPLRPPAA